MNPRKKKESLKVGTKIGFTTLRDGKEEEERFGEVLDLLDSQFTINTGSSIFFKFYADTDWRIVDE